MKRSRSLFLLSLLFLSCSLAADEEKTLRVQGRATLYRPADLMKLSIGVVTEHSDPNRALRENSVKMQQVLSALQAAGLTQGEYRTGQFSIYPLYSQASQESSSSLAGYRVQNFVAVQTQKLNLAADLIEAANRSGANSIGDLEFDLKEPRLYRREAIAKAAKEAEEDARALAEATHLKLKKILSIHLDEEEARPLYRAFSMAQRADSPPIEAGEIPLRASVSITYEIKPR
jgi:uncharacterized protein